MAVNLLTIELDLIQSIETVKVDGTGRYSFMGLFSRRPALSLAVFESSFFWVDDRGLWQVPQNQPDQKRFISKAVLPVLAVYHELQQPRGTSLEPYNANMFQHISAGVSSHDVYMQLSRYIQF